MTKKQTMNRESLLNGEMQRLLENRPGVLRIMPDDERDQMVADTLSRAPSKTDFWIFAYGSLIWNPAIEYEDKICCSIHGYHRSFCFWTVLGRGSEDQPGLMMGLEPGGECHGIAYRLAKENLQTEVDILFRREMLSYVYKPTWTTARCTQNDKETIDVLTFVVDEENERFCDDIDEQTMIHSIATATGPLGRNCDYLYQLIEHLDEIGFTDESMSDIANKVRAYQLAQENAPPG